LIVALFFDVAVTLVPPPHERNEHGMILLRHASAVAIRFPSPHAYEKLHHSSFPSLYKDLIGGYFLLLLLESGTGRHTCVCLEPGETTTTLVAREGVLQNEAHGDGREPPYNCR
jgi:hypothetical protein